VNQLETSAMIGFNMRAHFSNSLFVIRHALENPIAEILSAQVSFENYCFPSFSKVTHNRPPQSAIR